jgi:hypothetical protein
VSSEIVSGCVIVVMKNLTQTEVAYTSTRVVVLIERLMSVAYASTRVIVLIERLVYVAHTSTRVV